MSTYHPDDAVEDVMVGSSDQAVSLLPSGTEAALPSGTDVVPAVDAPLSPPEEQAEAPWYLRPWRERVQATDVAIGGFLLVIALVFGLVFFLGGTSTVRGSRPLAGGQLFGSPKAGHDRSGTSATVPSPPGSQPSSPSSPPAGASTPGTASPVGRSPHSASAAAGAPGSAACTPGDLTITTVTDSTSYLPGSPVVATTKVVDNVPCVFDPVPAGQYSCPTTMLIVNNLGAQVYPLPAQGEQCAAVAGGKLVRGATRTVQIVWNQAPAGQYNAVGTWSWGTGGSAPYQVSAASPPFTIGP